MTAREELSFDPIVPGQGLGPVFSAAAAATTAIVAAVIASAVAAVPGWAAVAT